MRSRANILAIIATAAAVAATVIGAVFIWGSDTPPPTTLAAPPTTTTTTSTTSTTTTSTTTTTIPVPVGVSMSVTGDEAGGLPAAVLALYTWMVDPAAEPPPLPAGLDAHLEAHRTSAEIDIEAAVSSAELADGSGVAVVTVGDDLILAVAEDDEWSIVGARLSGFDAAPWYGEPVRHVFVIGTDARPHESQPDLRADSIHIVGASLDQSGGTIVGFPRDTYVAASYGSDKYSSVNVRAGTGEMVQIAEELSGIEMDGYILTGFAGFKRLINGLGGVEIDIPFAMNDDDANAFLSAGLQVLKGGDMLAFSRNRHINGGDFTRSFHHGVVMQAVLTGIQAQGVERLPQLIAILSADTWTDLTSAQLLQLGAIAFELDPATVGNLVLPGSVGSAAGGASVVRLSEAEANAIFEDFADGVVSEE